MMPKMTATQRKKLMDTALGLEKADRVLKNARLVNVYSGECLDGTQVAVSGEWIAYVGPDASHAVGPDTEVTDCGGKVLIPGFIDAHTHLAWNFTVAELLPYAMFDGVTTLVTETIEPFPVGGMPGLMDFLDSLAAQPVKIFATAPPMMSISTAARGISPDDLRRLLERDDIVGLGEAYWQGALQEIDGYLPLFEQTLAAGKTLEGHSAGASEKKLNAYVAAGISSCHEPITAEEVRSRLRLGLHVMIREGSIRRDLEAIMEIFNNPVDSRRLILATDGVSPKDLVEKGYMACVVQKAVDMGLPPITAIQMASLNPAEHFGLDGVIGGIAPGRQADMAVIPDLQTIAPELVISRGCSIVENGKLLTPPRRHAYTEESRQSVRIDAPCRPVDFAIRVDNAEAAVEVRLVDLVTDLVTRESRIELPVDNGEISIDRKRDILKIAAVERTRTPGRRFTGLIRGFGLTEGAMASSAAWDTSDIVVVGADERDMADAVNRIIHIQGGAVVCRKGHIVAELPLPVLGILSDLPMKELAEKIAALSEAVRSLGFPYGDPLLTLNTLTGQAIPFVRICEEGLVNFTDGVTRNLTL